MTGAWFICIIANTNPAFCAKPFQCACYARLYQQCAQLEAVKWNSELLHDSDVH